MPSDADSRKGVVGATAALVVGLLLMGLLRWSSQRGGPLAPFAALATPGYVAITVAVVRVFVRHGVPLNRYGFGRRPDFPQLVIFLACMAVLVLVSVGLHPILEDIMGGDRDLARFAGASESRSSFWALMVFSWTFAAFGEEFVFRIVLMRGLAYLAGDTRRGLAVAVLGQAFVFGLIHAYQGPVGIAETFIDGAIFGSATVAARWSIWPAAAAHGTLNTIGIIRLLGV